MMEKTGVMIADDQKPIRDCEACDGVEAVVLKSVLDRSFIAINFPTPCAFASPKAPTVGATAQNPCSFKGLLILLAVCVI